MTPPNANFDPQRLRALASQVMDGTATEAEQQELTSLLRDTPSARDEYLMFVDMHAILATEPTLRAVDGVQKSVGAESQPRSDRPPAKFSWQLGLGILIAVAAAWLLVTNIVWNSKGPSTKFTTIVQLTDVKWSGEVLEVGDRFGAETLRFESGFVQLKFDSGVEVTLQGPATFSLLDPAKTRLTDGLLTATVPQGAEGFTVDTPTAQVIDLGTSFGIDLRQDGVSSVSVFDGEVEVAPHDATEKRTLTEGDSVRIAANQEIVSVDFDPQPFEKLWPISSGIVGSSEAFRFVPPWPKKIRFVTSNDNIFVATEGRSVELVEPLQVNISLPGEYARVEDLTAQELPSGHRVRSYILHFSPTDSRGPRRAKRVTGSITFDRPVLGLIVRHEELIASMRRFARRSAGELQQRRQLDFDGPHSDRIALSEDRRTVTLDVVAPGRNTDLVRVIVDGNALGEASTRIGN